MREKDAEGKHRNIKELRFYNRRSTLTQIQFGWMADTQRNLLSKTAKEIMKHICYNATHTQMEWH